MPDNVKVPAVSDSVPVAPLKLPLNVVLLVFELVKVKPAPNPPVPDNVIL